MAHPEIRGSVATVQPHIRMKMKMRMRARMMRMMFIITDYRYDDD
jgi:hypothetical protein